MKIFALIKDVMWFGWFLLWLWSAQLNQTVIRHQRKAIDNLERTCSVLAEVR